MPRGTGLRMLAALGAARALVLPRRCAARSLSRRAATETERGAPKLPKGAFRPKQSLGQNYLQDPNYAARIVDALQCDSERGKRVVELGPGLGALTKLLSREYPEMVAVELDERAIPLLRERYPAPITILEGDVLAVDYSALSQARGGKLSIIGNLPYYITSQILFCLCDHHASVKKAVVTMQWEVAQRLVAKPRTRDYGILSVVFQLYASPKITCKIPNTAFYPVPKVTSALVTVDFPADRELFPVQPAKLRTVLNTAFRQRRKMLRQSLKSILNGKPCPDQFATKRPEELKPEEFLELTALIFGRDPETPDSSGEAVWRTQKLRE
jgi:16S rRNA (adenine1518-N6/adenine1519-N6)-dimethyltransferase